MCSPSCSGRVKDEENTVPCAVEIKAKTEMFSQTQKNNQINLNTYSSCVPPRNTIYQHCIHVNALHMFTYPPNHEVLTDKLPGLLFGPLRGGVGEWPRTL